MYEIVHLIQRPPTSTARLAKSRQAIPLESPEPAPSTVTSDLSQTGTPGTNVPPDPTPPHVNSETGEIIDEPVKTTGMDGKQYSSAHHTAPAP